MTTFAVVGKNNLGPIVEPTATNVQVVFPDSLKLEVPEIKAPDIQFSPTFSPQFSPTIQPLLEPNINVEVEPPYVVNKITVPETKVQVVNRITLDLPSMLFLFAIGLFLVMMQGIINYIGPLYFGVRN